MTYISRISFSIRSTDIPPLLYYNSLINNSFYFIVCLYDLDVIMSAMCLPRLYVKIGGLVNNLIISRSLEITDQYLCSTEFNLRIFGCYLATIVKGVVLLLNRFSELNALVKWLYPFFAEDVVKCKYMN